MELRTRGKKWPFLSLRSRGSYRLTLARSLVTNSFSSIDVTDFNARIGMTQGFCSVNCPRLVRISLNPWERWLLRSSGKYEYRE